MRKGFVLAAALAIVVTAMDRPAMADSPVPTPGEPAIAWADAPMALKELKPGEYEVVVIHPYSCCPVKICFCLPCGCYDLKCAGGLCAKKLVFNYPGLCNNVVLKFNKDGSVSVKQP